MGLLDRFKKNKEEKKVEPDNDFMNLNCNEFGSHLVAFQKFVHDKDPIIFEPVFTKKFNDLFSAWEARCPNDANLTCANIIYHISDLSESQVREMLNKMVSQEPMDKQVHEHLLSMLDGALKFKGIK